MSPTIFESVRPWLLPSSLCLASIRVLFRLEDELTMKDQASREGNARIQWPPSTRNPAVHGPSRRDPGADEFFALTLAAYASTAAVRSTSEQRRSQPKLIWLTNQAQVRVSVVTALSQ
ncbi:hypothetical protein FIBSPDRAFT_231556 [Athelia psychrophila]|uniref:Uncharacterized protein n=1 Tax=Athelia psychrophila TaxID=1759441 RepID=A0A165YM50_9AGAM|nr:hypothetical protein FIBSPDRAFT_231556 [Fibularhizoctonia sp. CBS 109695]